ncbi:hypothetical protein COP2_015971 [Malus domestica]
MVGKRKHSPSLWVEDLEVYKKGLNDIHFKVSEFTLFDDNFFIFITEFKDGKTLKKPRRPYEKERLDAELKLVGEFGLRSKRAVEGFSIPEPYPKQCQGASDP